MPSTTWITAGAIAAGVVSYLAYFDYQRRHSTEFRKNLRAQNKRFSQVKQSVEKEQKQQQRAEITQLIDSSLEESPIPSGLQEREQFFIAEVSRADQLTNSGQYVEAALAFYRALASYPQPMELLGFYEKSIQPKEVLEAVRTMVVMRPPLEIASFMKKSLDETVE